MKHFQTIGNGLLSAVSLLNRVGNLENVKSQETVITKIHIKENKGYVSDTKLSEQHLNCAVLMHFSSE